MDTPVAAALVTAGSSLLLGIGGYLGRWLERRTGAPRPSPDATGSHRAMRASLHPAPRILLIEDDAALGPIVRHLVARDGLELDVAATRSEAERLLRAPHPYCQILADVHLRGGGDGVEVALSARPRVRVVAYSADQRALEGAMLAGADAALHKDGDLDELERVLLGPGSP